MKSEIRTYQLVLLQARSNRKLRKHLGEFLAEYNLTPMEWSLVGYISESAGKGLKTTDIAEEFSVEISLMTNMINSLSAKGFVVRTKHEEDLRIRLIKITKSGLKQIKSIELSLSKNLSQWLKDLSPKDIDTYIKVLTYIAFTSDKPDR